jgi:hypothetical protein
VKDGRPRRGTLVAALPGRRPSRFGPLHGEDRGGCCKLQTTLLTELNQKDYSQSLVAPLQTTRKYNSY